MLKLTAAGSLRFLAWAQSTCPCFNTMRTCIKCRGMSSTTMERSWSLSGWKLHLLYRGDLKLHEWIGVRSLVKVCNRRKHCQQRNAQSLANDSVTSPTEQTFNSTDKAPGIVYGWFWLVEKEIEWLVNRDSGIRIQSNLISWNRKWTQQSGQH